MSKAFFISKERTILDNNSVTQDNLTTATTHSHGNEFFGSLLLSSILDNHSFADNGVIHSECKFTIEYTIF